MLVRRMKQNRPDSATGAGSTPSGYFLYRDSPEVGATPENSLRPSDSVTVDVLAVGVPLRASEPVDRHHGAGFEIVPAPSTAVQ